ncbi:hypothetical protein ACWDG9_16480 [Streptomyces sp. NPDC001073]
MCPRGSPPEERPASLVRCPGGSATPRSGSTSPRTTWGASFEPNGHRADGAVLDVTPALRRRHLRYAQNWIGNQIHLDFSTAVFLVPVARPVTGRHP